MEITTKIKYIRTSPSKLNRVINTLVGLNINKALDLLMFIPNRSSKLLYNIVKSAKANAVNNYNLDGNNLIISEGYTGQAVIMKRMRTASKGKGVKIQKKYSHVSIKIKEGIN
jgi:large subunit ribosomal protein L22